jgi:hypothetical protein
MAVLVVATIAVIVLVHLRFAHVVEGQVVGVRPAPGADAQAENPPIRYDEGSLLLGPQGR